MEFDVILRVGRAVRNLKQEELSELSGVSKKAISDLEAAKNRPSGMTRRKILRAFEKLGVTFTGDSMKITDNPVFFVEGETHEETYLKLLEDAHEHLSQQRNPELLIMYADDSVSPPSVNDMYRKMRSDGVGMRQMIKAGNTYVLGPLEEYRYIPQARFINRVKLIYGDRIATETSNVLRDIIRVDPINAEIERNTFNMLWDVLEQPTETTANETF